MMPSSFCERSIFASVAKLGCGQYRPMKFALFSIVCFIVVSGAGNLPKGAMFVESPPEAYIILARSLADRHQTRRDSASAESDLQQTIATHRQTLRDLLKVAATSGHRDIAAIAEESAEAALDLLIQLKVLEALPKPPEADEMVAEGLMRLLFRGFGIIGRVEEIYHQDANLKNAFRALSEASARRERAKLKLAVIAAYYAGPPSPPSKPALAIDYDEAWRPEEPDRLTLANNTGMTLRHCTLLIELRGENNVASRNLYFIDAWEPENAIYGEYAGDAKIQDRFIKSAAVHLAQSIKISLWADELSQEDRIYQYAGAERDKDLARYLRHMAIDSRYRPFAKGVFFDTQRGLHLWLRGAELNRAFKIIVQFQRGNKGKSLEWTFNGWKPNEQKTLDTLAGDLPWDPEWYSVEIYFPELDYRWSDKRKIRL